VAGDFDTRRALPARECVVDAGSDWRVIDSDEEGGQRSTTPEAANEDRVPRWLIGAIAGQESVVIKGPWEQAQTGGSGALLFLKGDQLLEVHYRTSRATRADAIKLAAIAMPRLSP
jgi:hypothetical protein